MCASTPQKTRSELQVKWTRSMCRKKERVPTLYRQRGRDQEVNLSFGLSQKATLNTLIFCQGLHESFNFSPGVQYCYFQPRASLGRDHLALSAVTTWFAGATKWRDSSAALQVGPRCPRSGCGNRLPLLPSGKNRKTQPALVTVKQPLRHH